MGLGLRAALVLLLLAATLAPSAWGHNPALTVYEPAPLAGGLLVAGEEGTVALVGLDGTEQWSQDLQRHVIQAPVAGHGMAATLARNRTTTALEAHGFSAQGHAWSQPVGPAGSFGFLVAQGDGFTAFTRAGNLTHLSPQGEVLGTASSPVEVWLAPLPTREGGFLVGDRDGTLVKLAPGGQEQARAELPGRPSVLRQGPSGFLVGMGDVRAGRSGVVALDQALEEQWNATVPGVRVGGSMGLGADHVFLGTFRPGGAKVAAVGYDGQTAWTRELPRQTAAAAQVDGDRVYVTANDQVLALDATDGKTLWQTPVEARLVSVTLEGDLVLPSGANNTLFALEAATGNVAWTYSDGVDQVPWTDENLQQRPQQQTGPDRGDGDKEQATPLGALMGLVALAGAAVAWRRR